MQAGMRLTGAIWYSNGTVQPLGSIPGQMWGLTAYGINDSGQIVGDAETSSRAVHAFLYCNGTMQDLGTLGGTNSEAAGINNGAE